MGRTEKNRYTSRSFSAIVSSNTCPGMVPSSNSAFLSAPALISIHFIRNVERRWYKLVVGQQYKNVEVTLQGCGTLLHVPIEQQGATVSDHPCHELRDSLQPCVEQDAENGSAREKHQYLSTNIFTTCIPYMHLSQKKSPLLHTFTSASTQAGLPPLAAQWRGVRRRLFDPTRFMSCRSTWATVIAHRKEIKVINEMKKSSHLPLIYVPLDTACISCSCFQTYINYVPSCPS